MARKVSKILGGILGGGAQESSGPSAAELQAAQDSAAARERDRIASDEARKKAESEQKAVSDLQSAESKRRAFAGQLAGVDDVEEKRRFLKGA